MANKKEHIKWFLSEIPLLTEKGIIPAETAATLNEHYQDRLKSLPSFKKIFSLILGLIGITMAAAGIILFLNYNWDMFPKYVRIGIAALPLLLGAGCGYFTILRDKSQVWREASAILTSTGTVALIALLSQIYHTGGEFPEFMFLVSLLSLPLIYLFNSMGLTSLYLFFSFCVCDLKFMPWGNTLLIVLVLPYLLYHLWKRTAWQTGCRYLCILAALSFFFGGFSGSLEIYVSITAILLCSIFIVAGTDLLKNDTPFAKNPWFIFAFIVQIILLAIGSGTDSFFDCNWTENSQELWTFGIANVLLLLGYTALFFSKSINFERAASSVLIVLTAIPMVYPNDMMPIFFNIYMAIYGIFLIYRGIKQNSLLIFNSGAVTLIVLTSCRFFDPYIGVLYRSVGLVLLGIGFL